MELSDLNIACNTICYGTSGFVTVGKDYTVYPSVSSSAISVDGETWSISTTPDGNWNSVCFGSGLYVAVSNFNSLDSIMTSSDGINWTAIAAPDTAGWDKVIFANSLFVATGIDKIMTSTDGTTWVIRTTPASGHLDICYGNSLYVALGNGLVVTSSNGTNWTEVAIPGDWNAITHGGSKFVLVGNNRACPFAYSTDAATWTLGGTVVSELQQQWKSVCYGNSVFTTIASSFNYETILATSSDGISWTAGERKSSNNNWSSILYDNSVLIAVSDFGANGLY